MLNSRFLSTSSAEAIPIAAERLKAGHLVAFPTETVYGLGGDATNQNAVRRIYEVKGRPANHPLIVHISSINSLSLWAKEIPEYALELAGAFWPGPMTLILKRNNIAKDFITGGQEFVGIRVPSNRIALDLLTQFESIGGLGIAAPSANRFGQVSPTSSKHVQDEIGGHLSDDDIILEGGQSQIGIESTIVDCRNIAPSILRPGAITRTMLNSKAKTNFLSTPALDLRVSGVLDKHYAPNARVVINKPPKSGQAFMALSDIQTPAGVYRICSPRNIDEFAREMYGAMHRADELGFKELFIEVPVGHGIEVALFDRLQKAANGR